MSRGVEKVMSVTGTDNVVIGRCWEVGFNTLRSEQNYLYFQMFLKWKHTRIKPSTREWCDDEFNIVNF